jgi:ubiquinone/menaquinone biosynthesis C-methylase UbiE
MTENNPKFIGLGNSEQIERGRDNGIYDITTTSEDRYINPESFDSRIYEELSEIDLEDRKYSILDIGSSSGEPLEELTRKLENETEGEFESYGVDVNQQMLEEIDDAKPVKAMGQFLPFKQNSFDIIISANIHLEPEDTERIIQEINRVLDPDGFSILSQGYNREDDYRGLHQGRIRS